MPHWESMKGGEIKSLPFLDWLDTFDNKLPNDIDSITIDWSIYLSQDVNTFEETEKHRDPGQHQTQQQLPPDGSRLLYAARDVQHVVPSMSTWSS